MYHVRQFPDVLGMERRAAVFVLEDHGLTVSVCYTKPDRGNPPEGPEKVVRQEQVSAQEVRLTVCTVSDCFR